MDAAIIGGTGPTGPWLVSGLLERGYKVTILHRGTHEVDPEAWPCMAQVEHLHADPHFEAPLREVLGGRRFDVVIATYGRLRVVADVFKDRCDRLIGIGGVAAYRGALQAGQAWPYGMRLLAHEDSPLADELGPRIQPASRAVQKIVATEQYVRGLHAEGRLNVTWFRYPIIYGPGNPRPHEWYVVKRACDGRRRIIVADGGLTVRTRVAAQNAAHAVLLAVDQPAPSAGQVYNVGDDLQLTFRQWVDVLADACGIDAEVVSLPWELARPVWALLPSGRDSGVMSTEQIRQDLGYRDQIDPADALAEAVAWFRRHPPAPETCERLGFYFDYDAEDDLIEEYHAALAGLEERSRLRSADQTAHIYAHPKTARAAVDERGR